MTAIKEKIDKILKTVTNLDKRMKQMKDKFKSFDKRTESNNSVHVASEWSDTETCREVQVS